MALTYSLKYKKLNFHHRAVLEKEGEVLLDRHSFKLKGKGAQDQGETLHFGDIRELTVRDETLSFTTYSKEKYILSDFSSLFHAFLKDFVRIRNAYLADALFMKVGMLFQEYEGSVTITGSDGKVFSKGKSLLQIYEGSLLILPEIKECFSVHFAFLKSHEFDEDEYLLTLTLENGQTVQISKLGTSFTDFQENFETILGKMYERSINFLNEFLPGFQLPVLLKLAYKLKSGRFVALPSLKKTDEALPAALDELITASHAAVKEKIEWLRNMGGAERFFVSFSFRKSRDSGDAYCKSWFLQGVPEKNIIALGRTSSAEDSTVYFFRVIMDQGLAEEKFSSKVFEIDQALNRFGFDITPLIKDRRELKKSRYATAVKKLSFVRFLRKSYLGKVSTSDFDEFCAKAEALSDRAQLPPSEKSFSKRG